MAILSARGAPNNTMMGILDDVVASPAGGSVDHLAFLEECVWITAFLLLIDF